MANRGKYVKVEPLSIYKMLSMGWDKKTVLSKTGIKERTYFLRKEEFEALSEEERLKIRQEAEQEYSEKIFTKAGFMGLDIIKRWDDVMVNRNIPAKYRRSRIMQFRKICLGYRGRGKKLRLIAWRIHPDDFTEEHGVKFIAEAKRRGLRTQSQRNVIRNFLKYGKGFEPTRISGEKEGYGKMAKEYLNDDEVERVYQAIRDLAIAETVKIPLENLIYFMNHSATRAKASLRVTEKDVMRVQVNGVEVWQAHVIDKGKIGKQAWEKMLLPHLKDRIEKYLEWRRQNGLKSERLFYFGNDDERKDYDYVRTLMHEVYKRVLPDREIKQPMHIWRHTFAMHYLRKTGWNYDLVAMLGGWDDTKTLKDCYGKPEIEDVVTFVMQNGLFKSAITDLRPMDNIFDFQLAERFK